MTGLHTGHTAVRNNGMNRFLSDDDVTVAEVLKKAGYATGGFGKWGLGGPESDGRPLAQGIDRWFGYNCQRVAHNHYPTYLWDNEQRYPLKNPEFSAHQKLPADADPNNPASYAQYSGVEYAMDVITNQAVKFVGDHKDQPFFLYFPSIIPHLALQVPADSLAEYENVFPDSPSTDGSYLPHRTPRAAYAAMISRLDKHAGMLIKAVRDAGLDDRTIYIFTSDNGPLWNRFGGTDSDFFNSAPGMRGRKGSLYEGGVREPTIVCWPGHIAPGSSSDRVCGFEDWLPTLVELAGGEASIPSGIDGISFAPTLLGQEQPPRPFLYREFPAGGGQQSVRIGKWKGVRQNLMPVAAKGKGKGKANQGQPSAGKPNVHIELYDLEADRAETTDVSAEHPEIIAQMERVLREQHTPNPDFPFPALDAL
jgi:arylsulfatase